MDRALDHVDENVTWGAPYRYVRQLFQIVIVLMTKALLARPRYADSNTVQRLAMKAILGCYRTTPTAAMEIESDLQPVE
jgi:hypothetical protein